MDQAAHNKIVSFIWGIADDVLRDLFVRGKYRDVILPMCVLRRLDAVLEPTKQAVLEHKKMLDDAGITEQRPGLCAASKEAFYNISPYMLKDLKIHLAIRQAADIKRFYAAATPYGADRYERRWLRRKGMQEYLGTMQ